MSDCIRCCLILVSAVNSVDYGRKSIELPPHCLLRKSQRASVKQLWTNTWLLGSAFATNTANKGVVPQLLVVVQIFISQGQTINSLGHQLPSPYVRSDRDSDNRSRPLAGANHRRHW
jgi:hypothetical protein